MGVGGTLVFAHLLFQLIHLTCRMDQEFSWLSTQSDFNLTGHRELGPSVPQKEKGEGRFLARLTHPIHLSVSHVISQPGEPKR